MKIQDYCDIENGALRLREPLQTYSRGMLITDDPEMNRQLDMLERAGQGRIPLCIRGEMGSGKDYIAQYAHRVSTFHKAPFLKTNCNYLTEEQLYMELFGTSAQRNMGLLTRATGGSLYIKDADLMSSYLQYRLMHFISGVSKGQKTIRYIISLREPDTPLAKLSEEMANYFGTMVFDITPLRKRPQDILLLAFQQLQLIRQEYGIERKLSPEVMSVMLTYEWPGNIRQLTSAIERMAIVSDKTLMDSVHLLNRCLSPDKQSETHTLPAPVEAETRSLKRMVQDYEFMLIQQNLEQHGSIRKAAIALKTSHTTLSRKITEYNLAPKERDKNPSPLK